jgi:hypothetical protein
MENNSSPQPIIETDEQGSYFMVIIPHKDILQPNQGKEY